MHKGTNQGAHQLLEIIDVLFEVESAVALVKQRLPHRGGATPDFKQDAQFNPRDPRLRGDDWGKI